MTRTLNLSLPDELVKEMDIFAKQDYATRSDYIRQAIIRQIRIDRQLKEYFDQSRAIARKMGITSEQQVYDMIKELEGEESKTNGS